MIAHHFVTSSLLWGLEFLGGKEYPRDKPMSFLLLQTGEHTHRKPSTQLVGLQCFYTATAAVARSLAGHKSCFLSSPRPISSQLKQQCPSTRGSCWRIPNRTLSSPFPHMGNTLCCYSPPDSPQTALKNTFNKDTSKKRRGGGSKFNTIFPIENL